MRIWELKPTDATDPRWRQWNPTPILVQATDENEARTFAAALADAEDATAKSAAKIGIVYANPWGPQQDREAPWPTKCEDVTDGSPAPPATVGHD
jgi:hypothetical protein